jgi:Chaperone of endosialidase
MKKNIKAFVIGGFVASSLGALAVNIPNSFSAGTPIKASDVNANFGSLKTAVDSLEGKTAKLTQVGSNLTVDSVLSVTGRVFSKGMRVDANPDNGRIFDAIAADGTGVVTMFNSGDMTVARNIISGNILQGKALNVPDATISNGLDVGRLDVTLGMSVKARPGFAQIFNALAPDGTGLVTMFNSGDLLAARNIVAGNVMEAKAFNVTSDRNAKTNFSNINPASMLEKVTNLPISSWNYKKDGAAQRHVGPMAQDFHAAFGLNGSDEKHISLVDSAGVALAAIQGLNQKLEAENKDLRSQLSNLESRLIALEKK